MLTFHHTYLAEDYSEELKQYQCNDGTLEHIFQFPYAAKTDGSLDDVKRQEERREDNRQRLKDMASRKRQEKVLQFVIVYLSFKRSLTT